MPWSRRQLGVRDPDVLLLLPLLTRPHRHALILRTKSVDTAEVSCLTNLDLHHGLLGTAAPSSAAKLRLWYSQSSSFSSRSQNIRDPLRTKSHEKLWSTPPTVAVLLS